MIQDTVTLLNKAIHSDQRILFEGANATMLDIDFGTYPYVTSSSTVAGGICTGLGIPPSKVGTNIGVVKAYLTRLKYGQFRVGEGNMPTEQNNVTGEILRKIGSEFGATTGRPRRCGWIDIPMLKYLFLIIFNFQDIPKC
jgi:adenylosuccinate synthase